jgi:GAF domain-containing protein
MSDPSALQASVAALTQYFVGDATLGETLTRVAELTASAVPPADLVGITMMVQGQVGTYVFTHPEIPEIDRAQYEHGAGPCVDAFHSGETFLIRSTDTDPRWPAFCKVAREHGVRSTLSLPMIVNRPLGAMNLYSYADDAFTEPHVAAGEGFAAQAAYLLANAQAYWDARSLSENLASAMQSRSVIEQAKGVIVNAQGTSPDEAFKILIAQSQHENVKLRDIAARIVRDAQRKGSDGQ